MNNETLKLLYYYFPYPFKVLAASIHGLILNRWRHGEDYENEKIEAAKREIYTRDEIRKFQSVQLAKILKSAVEHVSWYKNKVEIDSRIIVAENSFDVLQRFPILEKEVVRETPLSLVNSTYNIADLYEEHTSGTTGTPLKLYMSKQMVERWYALFHQRWLGWTGVSEDDKWVIFGGKLVAGIGRNKPPYWVENWAMKQLYFSVYHISSQTVASYLKKLADYSPEFIITYPSALNSIVTLAIELEIKWDGPDIKRVIGNAEPFFNWQRQKIEDFFHTKTIDTYGASESVFMGTECENGNLHLSPDVGYWEILDDNDLPVENGEPGNFICTGFLNDAMPLIRYRTGDIVSIAKENCSCGLHFPVIEQIIGRTDDMIVLPDGRNIGRLDPIMKVDFQVKEVQFVQTRINRLIVKVVPAAGFDENTIKDMKQAILTRMGDQIDIDIVEVDSIPRTKAGKFKAVISELKS